MNERDPEQLNTPDASAEYSLEDIVREFGGTPAEDAASSEPAEGAGIDEAPADDAPPSEAPKGDTITFGTLPSKKLKPASPTIRLDVPVRRADELPQETPEKNDDELPAPIPIPTPEERKKAAEPTPQSVLKEAAAGRTFLRLRTVLLGILAAASVLLTLYTVRGWDFLGLAAGTPDVLLLILLSVCVLLSYDVLWRGILDLIHFRPSPFTLSAPLIALAGIDALRTAPGRPGNYCGAVTVLLFFLMRTLCAERSGRFYTLRTVCSFRNPMGIYNVQQVNEGAPSLRRDPAKTGSFLNDLLQRDRPQRLISVYSTVLFPLSAGLAFLLTRNRDVSFSRAWLLLLLGGLPFFASLGYPRIFAALARRLSRIGGALSGWHSAMVFGGKHTIIIRDEDLFPISGVTTNGMKVYGSYRPNQVISYALAALDAAGSPLSELFEGLLKAQYGTHSVPSTYRIYDNNGIGAEIGSDVILVGSLAFMRAMGVYMPSGAKVRLAVYVSVNGELAGIFALKYKANRSTRTGLRDVLMNRNFSVILATRDFLITPELIAAKYRLPTDAMKFPSYSKRLRLAELDPDRKAEQGGLIAKDTFGAFASTVAAGRTLRMAARVCTVICFSVAFLGLIVCALILLWNSHDAASPLHLLTFQLLWAFVLDFVTFVLLKL